MTLTTPAQALWNQRFRLADALPRLRALIDAVGRPTDLAPFQWAQLFAFTLDFQPDLIVELGRGYGNSTCCFLEAAARMEQPCRVVSLDRWDIWSRTTVPKLRSFCSEEWFNRGCCLLADICRCDFSAVLAGSDRCLVFWDAHGFDIAGHVLGNLLPRLIDREHVVVMHDLCDIRYGTVPRKYRGEIWQGQADGSAGVWLGNIYSPVPQAVSIVDFAARNRMPLHSAEESCRTEIGSDPCRHAELQRLLGDRYSSLAAHWFWFSLAEAEPPLTFPQVSLARPGWRNRVWKALQQPHAAMKALFRKLAPGLVSSLEG